MIGPAPREMWPASDSPGEYVVDGLELFRVLKPERLAAAGLVPVENVRSLEVLFMTARHLSGLPRVGATTPAVASPVARRPAFAELRRLLGRLLASPLRPRRELPGLRRAASGAPARSLLRPPRAVAPRPSERR